MEEVMSEEKSAAGTELPKIELGTHYFNQLYLYAFATKAEVTQYLRTQALGVEDAEQTRILQSWEALQPRVQTLLSSEAGLAESIGISEIPAEHQKGLEQFANDQLFQKAFSVYQTGFAMVEIDKLVAAQRTVNKDYVQKLSESFPKNPQLGDLLDICISPKRKMSPVQHLEIGQGVHVFSSPNSDFRFLGSFKKELTADDLEYAIGGGIPAAAIISFVGYGSAPINVLYANSRIILNNGFHRVFALRSMGVRHIPVVVQSVRNPALEFPPQVAGLPKDYLLGMPRPMLMKDFFEPDFTISIRVTERLKVVTIAAQVGQTEVPS
jgi:hypothetical protein